MLLVSFHASATGVKIGVQQCTGGNTEAQGGKNQQKSTKMSGKALLAFYKCLKAGWSEVGVGLSCLVASDGMRERGLKVSQGKVRLEMK